MDNSIAAVIVTFNRIELLIKCISAVKNQSHAPNEIIVVNNGSTDETNSWLSQQTGITLINQENSGGSGGQFTGIKHAYINGHDWVWCMDDDTLPSTDCLINLVNSKYFGVETTGFIASLVLWVDNSIHKMNIPYLKDPEYWVDKVMKNHCIAIKSCSFVSVLFSRRAIEKNGLPIKDFFIWYDDVEYTNRISQEFNGYLSLDSIAYHLTHRNEGSFVDQKPKEKIPENLRNRYKYGIRNKVFFYKNNDLTIGQKILKLSYIIAQQVFWLLTGKISSSMLISCFYGLFYKPDITKNIN